MRYLLQKYCPSASPSKPAAPQFHEVSNGEHLWVKEYPAEIVSFIETRKKQMERE